jgi:hypothetical protein
MEISGQSTKKAAINTILQEGKTIFLRKRFVKKGNYYMNNENAKEWLQLADDDLYSAKILNEANRKPYEIICYHCAQAAEKYLKCC